MRLHHQIAGMKITRLQRVIDQTAWLFPAERLRLFVKLERYCKVCGGVPAGPDRPQGCRCGGPITAEQANILRLTKIIKDSGMSAEEFAEACSDGDDDSRWPE